jgi:hypothetical protein
MPSINQTIIGLVLCVLSLVGAFVFSKRRPKVIPTRVQVSGSHLCVYQHLLKDSVFRHLESERKDCRLFDYRVEDWQDGAGRSHVWLKRGRADVIKVLLDFRENESGHVRVGSLDSSVVFCFHGTDVGFPDEIFDTLSTLVRRIEHRSPAA